MKKGIRIFIIMAAFGIAYVFSTGVINVIQDKALPDKDSIFLKTHWKQMGGFEIYTPDHMRLGCWSTALAQIMYYHKLKPFGRVAYTSRKGFSINENIDSGQIHLSELAMQIDKTTSPINIEALAKYNYDAALVVEKDFGTDSYMHKLAGSKLFESHYKVKATRYICWKGILPYSTGLLENVIKEEIHQKRPLFLHFANLKDFGHSVVIDGYKKTGNQFWVHLNQGQGGPQDGWYDFDMDLLKIGDHNLRVIYTFVPY